MEGRVFALVGGEGVEGRNRCKGRGRKEWIEGGR